MSGCIKYFDNDGKNMSFKTEDVNVLVKYIDIWNKIKEKLGIKFFQTKNFQRKVFITLAQQQ